MNTTIAKVDDLNAVITLNIENADYQESVMKVLKKYKKEAVIPGFRKGHIPMGLIKKQHGKAVVADEVNKLLQKELSRFIIAEKLDILGSPLMKNNEDFSWKDEDFTFEFEVGLRPEFELSLEDLEAITRYKVVLSESELDEKVTDLRHRYGETKAMEKVAEEAVVSGDFLNEKIGFDESELKLFWEDLTVETQSLLLGKAVGDKVPLEIKNIFSGAQDLCKIFKRTPEEIEAIETPIDFTITSIEITLPLAIDETLFKKVLGDDTPVKDERAFRAQVSINEGNQFESQADQLFFKAVTDKLLETATFDLPEAFLQKWLQQKDEKPKTAEEAKDIFTQSEKDIRKQVIESKIINDYDVNVGHEALQAYAKKRLKRQMALFGQSLEEKQLEEMTNKTLGNEQEFQRLHPQFIAEQLLGLYKEKINLMEEEVDHKIFNDKTKGLYE